MRPWGFFLVRGMGVTFGRLFNGFWQGARRAAGLPGTETHGSGATGVFTVQYPEERLPIPERFRVLPVLIYEETTGEPRCTACGICAKACPPQCIWILQAKGEDGKTRNRPEEFSIEANVCMNCGLCAEFCPFDAIKMDHRFELADTVRKGRDILNLQDLLVSSEYHARIHPKGAAKEAEARARKSAPKPAAPAAPAAG
ncbi:MAG: 4Fe-4S binding protein [Candidatus Coatesbacteria bacterium]